MKKFLFLLTSFFIFIPNSSSYAVEFGTNAAGDPNAIYIQGNSSGFLYSERIVFTAAHVLNQFKQINSNNINGYVYLPGITNTLGAKKVYIAKYFIPPTYVQASFDKAPVDDFAIIVLKEDIPLNNEVKIATTEQMESFAINKTKLQMVGYGLQSGAQRSNAQAELREPYKLFSYLYNTQMLSEYYKASSARPPLWDKLNIEFGAIHNKDLGSICNGDSGSGFFVEENNIRYYVGTAGNGVGISNCQIDGSTKFNSVGGMSIFANPNKFMYLLEEAEKFVVEEKKKEIDTLKVEENLNIKTTVQENSKNVVIKKTNTIFCIKKKIIKKITSINPKCPTGYTKK